MLTGLKKASTAVSDPRPGPQVPPAAGLGRGRTTTVTAPAKAMIPITQLAMRNGW
jgi:hypothetical protein